VWLYTFTRISYLLAKSSPVTVGYLHMRFPFSTRPSESATSLHGTRSECTSIIYGGTKKDCGPGALKEMLCIMQRLSAVFEQGVLLNEENHLWGQTSLKAHQAPWPSIHTTMGFPSRRMAWGRSGARSASMATGHHCFVQSKLPDLDGGGSGAGLV
jgi:hypothetical protein